MAATEQAGLNFEGLLGKLEKTVAELEQGQLDLEQMLEHYATGVDLVRQCRSILQKAEQMLPEETV